MIRGLRATLGIILGVVFGVLAVVAVAGFIYAKRRPSVRKDGTSTSKTAVAPQGHRLLRSQSVYVLSQEKFSDL